MVHEVTDKNYTEFIDTDKLVILKFSAEWCGPCRMSKSSFDYIAAKYEECKVGNVDVDRNVELSIQFKVEKIPLVLFMKNGEKVDEMPKGDIRRSQMELKINNLLQN